MNCPPERMPPGAAVAGDVVTGLADLAPRLVRDGRLIDARRLSGGASQETWAFEVAGDGAAHWFALRRAGVGAAPHPMAAGFAVEAAAIAAAGRAGVPVPEVRHLLTPADGLGEGFVSAYVAGETIARRIQHDAGYAGLRAGLAAAFGTILARVHAADVAALPPMRTAGIARTLDTLTASLDADAVPRPVFEKALAWARRHAPSEPADLRLVHGDFRLGNVIVGPEGVRAVLDWEIAHLGDPMEDLGWLCLPPWRFGAIERPVAGIGQRRELFSAYAAKAGVSVDPARVHWWEVVGSLRWGLFCAEMLHRFTGDDPSVERGMIVRRISESELDLLTAIDGGPPDV